MTEERRHEQAGESATNRGGDGRPAGVGEASPSDVPPADEVDTVAPEERGETPETEHAPGSDL